MDDAALAECPTMQATETQQVRDCLLKIGVPSDLVDTWLSFKRSPKVWKKIVKEILTPSDVARSFNANYKDWVALPKSISSLGKIKYPTLCGYSIEDLYICLTPYVKGLAQKFTTSKGDFEDNCQNAFFGLQHALETDAGISPFGIHVYRHLKTKIRRPVANDSMLTNSEHEYRKSQNIIHEELHNWLHARGKVTPEHRMVTISKQRIGAPRQLMQLVSLSHKLGDFLNRTEIDELQDHLNSAYKRIGIEQRRPYRIYKKKNKKGEMEDVKEYIVCSFLTSEHTISDIVAELAVNPNFHGKHASIDMPDQHGNALQFSRKTVGRIGDKEYTRDEAVIETPDHNVIAKERSDLLSSLAQEILPQAQMTPEQRTVANYLFGLNGHEIKSAVDIANNFGTYLMKTYDELGLEYDPEKMKARIISRQRVTQYMKTLAEKFKHKIYDHITKSYSGEVELIEFQLREKYPELSDELIHEEVCNQFFK